MGFVIHMLLAGPSECRWIREISISWPWDPPGSFWPLSVIPKYLYLKSVCLIKTSQPTNQPANPETRWRISYKERYCLEFCRPEVQDQVTCRLCVWLGPILSFIDDILQPCVCWWRESGVSLHPFFKKLIHKSSICMLHSFLNAPPQPGTTAAASRNTEMTLSIWRQIYFT